MKKFHQIAFLGLFVNFICFENQTDKIQNDKSNVSIKDNCNYRDR